MRLCLVAFCPWLSLTPVPSRPASPVAQGARQTSRLISAPASPMWRMTSHAIKQILSQSARAYCLKRWSSELFTWRRETCRGNGAPLRWRTHFDSGKRKATTTMPSRCPGVWRHRNFMQKRLMHWLLTKPLRWLFRSEPPARPGVLALTAVFRRGRNWPWLKRWSGPARGPMFRSQHLSFLHKPESNRWCAKLYFKRFCFLFVKVSRWRDAQKTERRRLFVLQDLFVGLMESAKESALLLASIQGCLAQRRPNISPIYQI